MPSRGYKYSRVKNCPKCGWHTYRHFSGYDVCGMCGFSKKCRKTD